MTPLAEARAVSVRAGHAVLLDQVELAVSPGERVAVIGPNGAGKSTLLRVLSGEMAPHAGSVWLKGRPVARLAPHLLARHRAVLSQSVSVAFPFTVMEVARMGTNDCRDATVDALVEAALAEVDLIPLAGRAITTLSGGEQHRAHLARVLVQLACGEAEHGPGLLLLDEPTASLDLRHQIDLVASMQRRARQGTAVIVVLHDVNLAATCAERIVVLDRGSVAADGPVDAVLTADVLGRVFAIEPAIGRTPEDGLPFILPQTMRARPTTRADVVGKPPGRPAALTIGEASSRRHDRGG